jgi:hypothetical protein
VSDSDPPRALLLNGTLGVGKTAVAVEIGEVLEERGTPYALIDLDWLCWAGPALSGATIHELLRDNLRAVSRRFLDAGVRRLVLARGLLDPSHLDAVRGGLPGVALTVVRLAGSPRLLAARLAARDTGANLDTHLAELAQFTARIETTGADQPVVTNDLRPIRSVALEVLVTAGWV